MSRNTFAGASFDLLTEACRDDVWNAPPEEFGAKYLAGVTPDCLNEEALRADLDAAWEVLAEPIQTVMRRYGVHGAYERLKEVTRGKTVAPEDLHGLIRGLEIPQEVQDLGADRHVER